MALYAFDGTWNEDEEGFEGDTNVVKFCNAYTQEREYREGVGTRLSFFGKIVGGVTGGGGRQRIREMYEEASVNFKNGDEQIDVIGFSRGAALAVHFCNVLVDKGLVNKEGQTVKPKIRFLGVWDIVASFGIPINFIIPFQRINLGYDLTVPDQVEHCFHAMAQDECRQTFMVTRLDPAHTSNTIEEVWFRGVHSDVGGGNGNVQLSNIPLHWMLQKAKQVGVPLHPDAITALEKNQDPPLMDASVPLGKNLDLIKNKPRPVLPGDAIHPSAKGRVLQPGESQKFRIDAPELYSWSGVWVEKGGKYTFEIPPDQIWEDGGIECGPEGWKEEEEDFSFFQSMAIQWAEGSRRHERANWFEVIGALGQNEKFLFRIGDGSKSDKPFVAPVSNRLFAFANDLKMKYDNNTGFVHIIVHRVA